MSTGLRFTLEVDGLPPDAFAVVSFHLNQSLSSLFSLDLSLVSQQFLSLEFAQVLDKMAYLTIWQGDEVQRRVKGVVTWFELGENDKNQMLYSATGRLESVRTLAPDLDIRIPYATDPAGNRLPDPELHPDST
ncbi:contractile injection system protein, VgrG/Pvc8 family, partial [Escherichia coli]